jgi:tetratricopeptide (TPR) repeat protein
LRWVLLLLVVAFSVPSLGADDAKTLAAQAKSLIETKEAGRAYALLEPHEDRLGGDVEFDYWLGVAAFETNHLDRAVIAFERVLVRDPLFDSARLELARTYLRMGALDLAAQEFERLQARSPSPEGKKLLVDYLAEIARLKQRQRYGFGGYVEAGPGRDTNISSSTSDFANSILGAFGISGIVPTGNSLRRADNFLSVNGGADAYYRLDDARTLYGAASVRWRGYQDFGDYDFLLLDFIGGYRVRAGSFDYNAAVLLQTFRQDGALVDTLDAVRLTNDRDSAGVNLEVRRDLDAATSIAIGLQWMAFRYPTNHGQDTNQVILSLALDQRPAWLPTGTNIGARLFFAHDEARQPLNPFTETTASRHSYGVRLFGQTDPGERLSWQVALGWTLRIDDDAYARASLIPTGRDNLYEALVRASYRIVPSLYLQPYAGYAYNKSNIELYSFRKADGGVMLRWEFR